MAAALAAAATALLYRHDPTSGARLGAALAVTALLWGAWRVDNHTGSCLMITVLALIVAAVLALLMVGMALP